VRMRLLLDGVQSHESVARSARALLALLGALVTIDEDQIRAFDLPPLYASGVRYFTEPAGVEDWQDVVTTLARGGGDCEDLVPWRVAELRVQGIAARPVVKAYPPTPTRRAWYWHILLKHGDERVEDPSRALGMGEFEPFSPYTEFDQLVGNLANQVL